MPDEARSAAVNLSDQASHRVICVFIPVQIP